MHSSITVFVLFAAWTIGQPERPSTGTARDPDEKQREQEELLFRKKNENVKQVLEELSDFDFVGHPASFGGFAGFLSTSEFGWSIRAIEDKPALEKHGIRLDDVAPYRELRAGGISRRSSLRFTLDAGGVAYYVDDKTLVVTTKHLARVKWLEQLNKPAPKSLSAPAVGERRDAAFAAGFWHLDPDTWIEPLAKALSDRDRQVSFDAAYALGEFGPQAAKAIDPLVNLLRSKDLRLREAAVFALGKIGPRSTQRLLELIDDPDSGIAVAAAKSFTVMGSVGMAAAPKLIEAAKRRADDEDVCDAIAEAIAVYDPEEMVPKLCELLKSGRSGIRSFAAYAIAEIRPPAETCAKELLPLLADPTTRVRSSAAHALSQIDLPAEFPTAELEAAVKDPDRNVSVSAAAALHLIKSQKRPSREP